MDRMEDSGSFDLGSNPGGVTQDAVNIAFAAFFIVCARTGNFIVIGKSKEV